MYYCVACGSGSNLHIIYVCTLHIKSIRTQQRQAKAAASYHLNTVKAHRIFYTTMSEKQAEVIPLTGNTKQGLLAVMCFELWLAYSLLRCS